MHVIMEYVRDFGTCMILIKEVKLFLYENKETRVANKIC